MTIIHSTSTSPAFNLAAEEYLFNERQDDLLFLYVNEPSVIIGCNQAIRNEVDLEYCGKNGIRIIRRMSGGGAVFHDLGNFNFCFISNKTEGKSSLNDDFLQPIVEILIDLGIFVEIGKRKDLWLQGGFKITGTASHVGKSRELHHGTLLYDTDLGMLENALATKQKDNGIKAIASVRSKVKNLRLWLEEQGQFTLSPANFFDILQKRISLFYQQSEFVVLHSSEIIQIRKLSDSKYLSEEWLYKK